MTPMAIDPLARVRPLIGGISIANGTLLNAELGTIGFIGTSDGIDRWIVSCYHVLCGSLAGPQTEDCTIYQPSAATGDPAIAVVEMGSPMRSQRLDCAAAPIAPSLAGIQSDVLGFGTLSFHFEDLPPSLVGREVAKFGAESRLTLGIVHGETAQDLRIKRPPGTPGTTAVTTRGDSGALWIDTHTNIPVGLNRGWMSQRNCAVATRIEVVLQALGLRFY